MTGITVGLVAALTPLVEDSSRNQFSFWTTVHEPLDVAWYAGKTYVAFLHRSYSGSLKMYWSTDNARNWQALEYGSVVLRMPPSWFLMSWNTPRGAGQSSATWQLGYSISLGLTA